MQLIKHNSKDEGESGLNRYYILLTDEEALTAKAAVEASNENLEILLEDFTESVCEFLRLLSFDVEREFANNAGDFFRRSPYLRIYRNRLVVSSSWGYDI